MVLMFVCSVNASASTNKTNIETCVRDYVEGLIRIQESNNTEKVSPDQFETINGYAIATWFMIDRDGYNCISEDGIHDLEITAFNILSIEEIGSQYEVSLNVSYRYLFNGKLEANVSCPYRVTVINNNGKYQCVDIYTNEDDRVNEIIDELAILGLEEKDQQVAAVNDRIEQIYRDMYASMPKQKVYQTMDEISPDLSENDNVNAELSINSTNVSYNATRAATYASTYGGMSQNFIF
jgi:hypothetical protein